MKIISSSFIKSSSKSIDCPDQKFDEFAFIGRSNVGKSSLINSITNSKKLAKISGTPGKTLLINHFLINKKWFLVDLPGYGFARKSKK
ncbi:50S ribosome-binding GTPase, partial [Flavobacteriaceae bacterium]|nr:50S ribosome-binding GTPase [Flavobacteriaceae bacterium]